jgi:hypothetical protein
MCRESLCLSKVLPFPGMILDHSPLALPSVHRYYELMRQTSCLCSPQLFRLVRSVFAGCCKPLLTIGPSQRYLCKSFFGCLTPYPGVFLKCIFSFLPSKLRPSSSVDGVGFPQYPVQQLQYGKPFRDCRYSLLFKPPNLLTTLVARTNPYFRDSVLWFLLPSRTWVVTFPCIGYANCVNEKFTVQRLSLC